MAPAISSIGAPLHGTAVLNANGTITYTPSANYNGPDSISYTVTSGDVSETATITVNVAAVNDAPTAANGSATGTEDTPLVFNWAQFNVGDVDTPAASLSWVPRRPGTLLRSQLQWPLLAGIAFLAFLALLVVRRGRAIVNELIASETRARHLAYHDQLTQLPNRALLFEKLRTLLGGRFDNGRRLGVICVDLDRFKEVNDTLGHHVGDDLIQTVAARLRETCAEHNVEVFESVMSLSGMVNVGQGGLVVGFAAEPAKFE